MEPGHLAVRTVTTLLARNPVTHAILDAPDDAGLLSALRAADEQVTVLTGRAAAHSTPCNMLSPGCLRRCRRRAQVSKSCLASH